MHSPLRIQLHQLAHIEAELDIGHGAAGISLTAGTGIWWHQDPGDADSPCHLPASHPGKVAVHHYSLKMLYDKGRVCDLLGDVGNHQCPGNLGEEKGQKRWVSGGLRAISLPSCSSNHREGRGMPRHQLPPGRLVSTGVLNTHSHTRGHCQTLPPLRQTQQSFNLKRQGSRRDRFASGLPRFLQKMEKISLILPCLPSHRLFLKLSLHTETTLSAKYSYPLVLNKAGLEEGWLLTFSFSLYSRWTEW